jgi:hypothetical protein
MPINTAAAAVRDFCHTSDRTWEGDVYTISDERAGDLNGRKVIARLSHGKTVVEWFDADPDREIKQGLNGSGARTFHVGRHCFDNLPEAKHWLEWC